MCIFNQERKKKFLNSSLNAVSVATIRLLLYSPIAKMAKNLYKVQKQISKKKGKLGTLHEHSRDSRRLQAAGGREEKLARAAAVTNKSRKGYGEWVAVHDGGYVFGVR